MIKVEARGAAHNNKECKTHANSNQICAIKAQKDRGGCGACRMANIHSTIKSECSRSNDRIGTTINKSRSKAPERDFGLYENALIFYFNASFFQGFLD